MPGSPSDCNLIDRILILGTGLLGASTGLSLREAGFNGTVIGWDKDPRQAEAARELQAIHAVAETVETALAEAKVAQLTLIATPVYAILDWMEQLAPILSEHQLVSDVGSTKSLIAAAAERLFNQPGRAAFLPGHPMAGKEFSGAAHADGALFRNAVWLFTPMPTELPAAPLAAEWREWVQAFGCRTLEVEAARHDELVAWVSHLPQFLSTALTALLETKIGDAPELTAVGGRALREMTRLGASPYSMWRDIAYTNTEAIASSIHALEQRLAHLRENLRTPELREEFELANRFRK
ncbi:MAG TPA: prephenate dehydrogenase/arogenate dehydrogenase family protein [Acidobacteriaceae bacterium]